MDFGCVVVQDRKTGKTKARYEYVPKESLKDIEDAYTGSVFLFLDHRLLDFQGGVM